jgi:glycosyltransferase involved in cell wall biosynthesis
MTTNKKRILIAMQYMEIGGVERSLLGLLDAFDHSRFEVDLFLYRHSGELMKFIPREVRLLPEIAAYTTLTRPIAAIVREGYPGIAWGRLSAKIRARIFGLRRTAGENCAIYQYVADATTRFLPPIAPDTEYDLAISFIAPHNIVRDKVRARRKIAWIHTDYMNIAIDTKRELLSWSAYDHIAAISDDVRKRFIEHFPTLGAKVTVIENILSADSIKKQASLEHPALKGDISLLTVGRFCHPKAFDNAVRICAELISCGVPVKWYAIGYGDRAPIDDAIRECGMEDHFVILGKKENPYPWIAACDIYVQPSRYEGKAVTVREAQILSRPVVITAFATSASQLRDGFDGVIVPMDVAGAARGIRELINNPALQKHLRCNCAASDYSSAGEIEKIYDLI